MVKEGENMSDARVQPDPGNSAPEAWTAPLTDDESKDFRTRMREHVDEIHAELEEEKKSASEEECEDGG